MSVQQIPLDCFHCTFIMIISGVQNVPSALARTTALHEHGQASELERVDARMTAPHKIHNTILAIIIYFPYGQ